MFIRTITYTRPDTTTEWPWMNGNTVIPEVIAYENYVTSAPTPGLITRFREDTDNTYTYTLIFESEEAFNAHASTEAQVTMRTAIEEIMVSRNITKTTSSVLD